MARYVGRHFSLLIGLLIVLVALVGLFAPTELVIERQIEIKKPRIQVFEFVRKLQNQGQWSPWEKKDPQMQKQFRGVDGQVGAVIAWSGNDKVGVGEQEITQIREGERIDYELRFKEPMEQTNTAYILVESISESESRVRWGMQGNAKFPGNIFTLILNVRSRLNADFDDGLQTLKSKMENPNFEIK